MSQSESRYKFNSKDFDEKNVEPFLSKEAALAATDDNISVKEIIYPPFAQYLVFCLIVNAQALSFGTTISFTGPTLSTIIDDMQLCQRDDDGEVICSTASFLAAVYALSALVGGV